MLCTVEFVMGAEMVMIDRSICSGEVAVVSFVELSGSDRLLQF